LEYKVTTSKTFHFFYKKTIYCKYACLWWSSMHIAHSHCEKEYMTLFVLDADRKITVWSFY